MIELFMESIGWIGAVGYLLGYFLHNEKKVNLFWFNVITFITSLIYVIYGVYKTAYPSAVINAIFILVTFKYFLDNSKPRNKTIPRVKFDSEGEKIIESVTTKPVTRINKALDDKARKVVRRLFKKNY